MAGGSRPSSRGRAITGSFSGRDRRSFEACGQPYGANSPPAPAPALPPPPAGAKPELVWVGGGGCAAWVVVAGAVPPGTNSLAGSGGEQKVPPREDEEKQPQDAAPGTRPDGLPPAPPARPVAVAGELAALPADVYARTQADLRSGTLASLRSAAEQDPLLDAWVG